MNLSSELQAAAARHVSRRWFLRDCGVGLASIALSQLLTQEGRAAVRNPHAARTAPLPAKAKRVIFLFQAGGPSHLELFDNKPELTKRDGQLPPAELLKNYRSAFINPNSALLAPKFKFQRHGQTGLELSELLPHLGKVADELCVIKSMQTDAVNHAPAQIFMNTGSQQFGRPSLGAWSLYGLGSEAENLPGYVVLSSAKGTSGGASNWGCGFLPTIYGGTPFRSSGDPILYLSNPKGLDQETQRASLDALERLNQKHFVAQGDPEITARIQAYEMAYKLQQSAPDLMDLSQESQATLELYGCDPKKAGYARNCLLARRLVERGVRFVQLFHEAWDQHGGLATALPRNCRDTDQATAALIMDLKQRGLLDDTLVVWGGEFGRTPMVQGSNDGRDHHNRGFTMLLAGGGVKRGYVHGATDDFGFNVVRDPVHVHDLHATILHLLGFDHTKLTFRFQGRDYRLTDVHGQVVRELIA
ncbi:MAG TPA: DUF1501 domain-containing protein [Opitutaceae bacterium]|nr:DUF1501 domain-containing protein [Opitutaceae bacterium]